MNKLNYLALGAVAITLISVFSPWLEVSDSVNSTDLSNSFEPVIIHGISIGYGIFGFLVALLGGYLVYKEFKWTFVTGIVNFINGYGYLHEWFGAGTHDSGNYGDVTSQSIVDPKFGIYLFILASLAFIIFTLKYYKFKKTETISPSNPFIKEYQQPAFTNNYATTSKVYQQSKIQTMTTSSTELPTEPASNETPKIPETPSENAPEQPTKSPSVPEPTVPAQPVEAPKAPVHIVVNEPARVYQAPIGSNEPQKEYVEPQKNKTSTTKILLLILAFVIVCTTIYVTLISPVTNKSTDKTEQSINDEKSRLEIIIHEVNQAVNDKKYDDALLKINSVNWLYDPTANKGYVDQYNSQRENLRNTIVQLKSEQNLDDQKQAAEKANESVPQPVQNIDTIQ